MDSKKIVIKSEEEIDLIRESALLVSKTLKKHMNKVFIKNGVSKSVFFLALATFPLVFMALFLEYARLLDLSRQVEIIAFSNLIFALFLFVSDRKQSQRKFSDITARDVLVIGIWQSFAVLPGTSRSGASITGARFLNYGRNKISMQPMGKCHSPLRWYIYNTHTKLSDLAVN